MYLTQILVTIVVAAAVTRFLRLSALAAPLRDSLSARSPLLAKLFSCPHCLCFWTSLGCALVLAPSWLVGAAMLLVGWRGGYYTNRLIDNLAGVGDAKPTAEEFCHVCGLARSRDFLDRHGRTFCSYRCWFSYLKEVGEESRRAEAPVFTEGGLPARQEAYPAAYSQVTVQEARERLVDPEACSYIDVRTPEEFDNGHPAGAVNIPLYLRADNELTPNADFVRIVALRFPRDARLLVGDGVGSLALAAARVLTGAGFTQIAAVRGGYYGTRDLQGGVVDRGWARLGFPVEYQAGEDQCFQGVLEQIARKPPEPD